MKEFRLINASEKAEQKFVINCQNTLKELADIIDLKDDHQGMQVGEYIVFKNVYHQDAIITYKIPRVFKSEVSKFPEDYRDTLNEIQEKMKLTKSQFQKLYECVIILDENLSNLDKKMEVLKQTANKIKEEDARQKRVDKFFKTTDEFSGFLNSDLVNYNKKTRIEIKERISNLPPIILDTIDNYLK